MLIELSSKDFVWGIRNTLPNKEDMENDVSKSPKYASSFSSIPST